ncbi:MAG: hypothetical protein ACI90V_001791 [Bacillariaceae sp.]|jgi:hypothetical protein
MKFRYDTEELFESSRMPHNDAYTRQAFLCPGWNRVHKLRERKTKFVTTQEKRYK